MKVELLACTPESEMLSAMAAKLTHSASSMEELKKSDEKELRSILRHVIKIGHESVIEHAYFTFAISGVSRALTHQLVRHRIASYSQQSQRYVENEMEYIVPPSIKTAGMEQKYKDAVKKIWDMYDELKEKVPVEDARYILPNAACTKIMVSMNARSLLNFFELRCCLHAQWEIRMLAWKMLKMVKGVCPVIFENAGPPCKTKHICPMNKKECRWYPKEQHK
ncbi:MAG: FAD-dependent thymidylate synthase [Candidatus Thermoplasmatota archaeon]|nr:FAD-dependent thymidylate synthase [Candidatus Thermoplasmatota archaeon]